MTGNLRLQKDDADTELAKIRFVLAGIKPWLYLRRVKDLIK